VRKLGADRAVEFDQALAQQMYEGIITDYPEQDALVVQTHYALAKLSEEKGDRVAAEKYYNQVLSYTPTGANLSEAEADNIEAFQNNAVASMLTAAIQGADSPQERLKALKKFLEKHGELERAHADLVQRFAQTIERHAGAPTDDEEEQGVTVEALLASLKKSQGNEEGAQRRDRARTREQRARDAEAERTRIARRENVIESALMDSGVAGEKRREAASTVLPLEPRANGVQRTIYSVAALCAVGLIAMIVAILRRRKSF
jgi:hypothetical protein